MGESDEKGSIKDLFSKSMRLVIVIGVVVGVLQQITGINSVFFYAPMIFEQSGIGTDASFVQAILVGLVNLVFTVLAIMFIDKLGRKPLLSFGVAGIAICMMLLAYGFSDATYTLTVESITALPAEISASSLEPIMGITYESDTDFKTALGTVLSMDQISAAESALITAAIKMNPMLILIAILGFVASFAISIGPVMWVLFSELFPNKIRGLAISFVGLINSAVSFLVQWIFPWELATLGSTWTFLIYGLFAAFGLIFIVKYIPETKGRSLEELEKILIK
jgi:SP family arabinose:H+ symporter-like MFS transporter